MDTGTEQMVLSGLKEHLSNETMIIVTHRMAPLNLVDRIIVLENGASPLMVPAILSSSVFRPNSLHSQDTRQYGTPIRNSALLFIMVIFTGFFVYWANQVEFDEMTRIQGVVMPSSKEKVIQSEFNGRLTEIWVKLGDRLAEGDLIAKVSDEEMAADRETVREDLLRSNGRIHRIEAMQSMEIPSFPAPFVKSALEDVLT